MSQTGREVSYWTIVIGAMAGALVDWGTPLGPYVRSALYNIGFSPLWARSVSAGLIVGVSLVVALRVEAIIRQRKRRKDVS